MPANVIKSFAEKTGKSEAEVEKLWDEAKKAVKDGYPDVKEGDDRFYQLVTGILKKMIGLNETLEFDEFQLVKEISED